MLRKLLIITCLLGTVTLTYGQKKKDRRNKKQKTEATSEKDKTDYKVEGAPMPSIKLVTRELNTYSEKDFEKKSNLFVMIFNPTCDHCIEMTHTIEQNIDLFKENDIVLMSAPSMLPYMEYYDNTTKYSNYPKLKVGVDSAGFIDKVFVYQTLPQINVYNKKRKLLKTFTGDVPIDALKEYID